MQGFKTSKPWLYAALGVLDVVGHRIHPRRSLPRRDMRPPGKILVSNIAHLGDVLLSIGVPGAIKRIYPDAEIHVLVSSRAAPLIAGHPAVSRVHFYDSLLLNWPAAPLRRLRAWLQTLTVTLRRLRRERYDLAVDLRAYFPNALPLLALARPGRLVGFGTAGFGFLLDDEVEWRGDVHELERFQDVVDAIAGLAETTRGARLRVDPDIEYLLQAEGRAASTIDATHGTTASGGRASPDVIDTFVVLHPGTRVRKRWLDASWRTLAANLCEEGWFVVVTGTLDERPWLARLFSGLPVRMAAGTTNVPDLARIFRRARLYIGVDSFASHLAVISGTPRVVVIWNRFADAVQWGPVGPRVVILDEAATPVQVARAAFAAGPPQRKTVEISS